MVGGHNWAARPWFRSILGSGWGSGFSIICVFHYYVAGCKKTGRNCDFQPEWGGLDTPPHPPPTPHCGGESGFSDQGLRGQPEDVVGDPLGGGGGGAGNLCENCAPPTPMPDAPRARSFNPLALQACSGRGEGVGRGRGGMHKVCHACPLSRNPASGTK